LPAASACKLEQTANINPITAAAVIGLTDLIILLVVNVAFIFFYKIIRRQAVKAILSVDYYYNFRKTRVYSIP
jgi:hypothetical protein